MKVLVTAASKHGATAEVADRIAQRMRSAGLDVDCMSPDQVESMAGYDAAVVGSAVYITQWMDAAVNFIKRYTDQLRSMPLWAFSVGLSGVPKGNVQDSSRIGPVLVAVDPRHHVTFAGRLDPSKLNLRERSIARLGGAVEGDYREWQKIDEFADAIVQELEGMDA